LIKNKRIGFGPAIVFAEVWEMAGGAPGEISGITTKELARRLNRDRATVLGHVKKLNQFYDLFDVKHRYPDGCMDLRVFRPCPSHATAKPDKQRRLPAITDEDTLEPAAEVLAKPTAVQGSGPAASQEPQRSGIAGEPQRLATVKAALYEGRGENPTGTADPWGKPHALAVSTVGNSPRPGETDRGENPTPQKPPNSAGKQAVGNSPRHRGENPTPRPESVGKTPRGENPTVENAPSRNIPAHAPVFKDSSKEESLLKVLNDSMILKDFKDAREGDDAAVLAAAQRAIDQRRAAAQRREPPPPPTFGDVFEGAATAFLPDAQKDRLVTRLRGLVNDPGTADWLFGYAADLMVVHGQDTTREDAHDIFGRMQGLIGELKQIRDAQTQYGQVWSPRGAWFNRRVTEIAKQFHIKLPHELKQEREARRRQLAGVP